jgi:hypothetical protein
MRHKKLTFFKCHIFSFTVLTIYLPKSTLYMFYVVRNPVSQNEKKNIYRFSRTSSYGLKKWALGAGSKTAMEKTAKWGLRFSYASLNIVWVIRSSGWDRGACGLSGGGGSRNKCMLLVRKTERKRSLARTKRRRHVNLKMDIGVGWKVWHRKWTHGELLWRVKNFRLQYHPRIFLPAEEL